MTRAHRNAISAGVLMFALCLMRAPSAQEADASNQMQTKRLFMKCRVCHTVDKDGAQETGPNLYGVFGSKAGSRPGFNYSDALKRSNVVWTDETLDQFLSRPQALVPGTRMGFAGLPNETDRKLLTEYLKSLAPGR